jgi:hypothetical protein
VETIGGHIEPFEKVLLTDILEVDFALDWGALVDLCRESGPKNSYHLMFFFAPMSFRMDVKYVFWQHLVILLALKLRQFANYFRQHGDRSHIDCLCGPARFEGSYTTTVATVLEILPQSDPSGSRHVTYVAALSYSIPWR